MSVMFGNEIRIDEDDSNEFKMHTKNVLSEVQKSKYERNRSGRIIRLNQPNSKVLCAFLNTKGGRLFLGVNDDGKIIGLKLTEFQLDHAVLSLHHTLKSFTPPVPPYLVQLKIIKVRGYTDDCNMRSSDFCDEYSGEAPGVIDHVIGRPFCYCFQNSTHQTSHYLIIIDVKKPAEDIWYQNEEGLVYIRRNGSNKLLTIDALRQFKMVQYTSKCLSLPTYERRTATWDHVFQIVWEYCFPTLRYRRR